jgi:hypothetical protein
MRRGACPEGVLWARRFLTLEDLWQHCPQIEWMLWGLSQLDYRRDRRLRLFAVACARRHWDLLLDARSREVIAVAERYAHGEADEDDLVAAREAGRAATRDVVRVAGWTAAAAAARAAALETARDAAMDAARGAALHGLRTAAWEVHRDVTRESEEAWQTAELRRVVGDDLKLLLMPLRYD